MVKTGQVKVTDIVNAIANLKTFTAASQDGAVVGVDSVSGDDYFQNMPCIGTIYIGKDKLHRIVVDVLAYPAHVGDSGKKYADENRMISVAFDPKTMLVLPGTRRNNGFSAMATCAVLSIDPFTWVEKQLALLDAEAQKAAAAKKALDLKKVASSRQSAMNKFIG